MLPPPLLWSSVTRQRSTFEFGANFSRASAGRIAVLYCSGYVSQVRDVHCDC